MIPNPAHRSLGLVLPAILVACGGGSGSGDGSAAIALRLEASGVVQPLWQGSTVGPPACGGPVFQNSNLVFTFSGPVDPASLPPSGPAQGSVNIVTAIGAPLEGSLAAEDDPSLPAGNRRRVVFRPELPATAAAIASTGIVGPVNFFVFVPAAGSPGPHLLIDGQPLSLPIITCFAACDPGTAGCFTDTVPGAPSVTSTLPDTGDPPPPPIPHCSVTGNRFSVLVSEPLRPVNIDTSTVRLRSTATGAQLPGQVQFFQAGTPEGGPAGARIDYVTLSPPPAGVTYELTLDSAITDFGGNPITNYAPGSPTAPATGRRLFATVAAPFLPQPPIVEDFTSTANLASVSGTGEWTGNGVMTVRNPEDVFGNGAFGPLVFGNGPGSLDPGQAQIFNGGLIAFEQGNWNLTVLSIAAGATVRCTGHTAGNLRRIHLRCLGGVVFDGVLNASAGNIATAPLGTTEQGARAGNFNNGNPGNPTWVAGGVGGSGGGRGGNASQADQTGPSLRTPAAEAGFGPPLGGTPNVGPFGANPLFGGGEGGEGGFLFPQGGATGEVGGLGGAGGSSLTSGLDGGPNAAAPACTPLPAGVQTRALATGPPAAFIANPITIASAGSGGGGGGDKFDPAGVANDDQGGGGGGGGGGIRISAVGNIFMNSGSSIIVNGGNGGQGNVFQGGHGGSGSGGEIWMQSFAQIVIAAASNMQVNGGTVNNACGSQAGGRGGNGVYQFEDSDGMISTAFGGIPAGGGNVQTAIIPYSSTSAVTGTAISNFFDTGYGAPEYASAIATITAGTVAGVAVTVTYQGAHEVPSGGSPDPATFSPPVPATQIDQLDGYRYIRFTITITFPFLPLPPPGTILPSVDDITISFSAPAPCP